MRQLATATLLASGLAAAAAALTAGAARAQGDEDAYAPLSGTVIASRAAVADRLLAAGDARGALAAYDALQGELYDREQYRESAALGCRSGVARLRAQQPLEDALRTALHDLGGGLAVAESDAARRACLEAGARALVEAARGRAGAEGATAELAEDLWMRAGTWVRRARAMGDSDALRAAHEALPAAVRAELDRLGSIALDAEDGEALVRAVERALYLADPTRLSDCIPDTGLLDCYSTQLPEAGWGNQYPHIAVYFVETADGVRTIGSAPRMPGYECETGVIRETLEFTSLTRARHGIDGTLRVVREGGDDGEGWQDLETVADVCDSERRACRSVRLGRRQCAPDDQGRSVCREGWEASVRASRGVLTLRARRGRLPAGVSPRVDLTTLFAAVPGAPTGSGAREGSGRCHAEVADPRPPLNVRTLPDQTSPIAGALPDRTVVRPRERRRGWVRIDQPIAGWIWARNLRRVCD